MSQLKYRLKKRISRLRFLSQPENRNFSPFVAEIVNVIQEEDKNYYCFAEMEKQRQNYLLFLKKQLRLMRKNQLIYPVLRRERELCKKGGPRYQMLFRLMNHLESNRFLLVGGGELLACSYLSKVNSHAEGNYIVPQGQWPAIWNRNRKEFGLDTVKFEEDDGNNMKLKRQDFVYFTSFVKNGELKEYWQRLKPCLNSKSVVLVADLHKDQVRSNVWEEIKRDELVRISVDLNQLGLLFMGDEKLKKDYVINL